ncbi:unnamed protein product [Meloidogyne enterolobii]|uniref:Uncharacterized protein n=1 Tax=Meloidogyne enterolobii TaxID=390850 RepID=A0ACB1A561_MELEN
MFLSGKTFIHLIFNLQLSKATIPSKHFYFPYFIKKYFSLINFNRKKSFE